ncbi:MAG TPA: RNA-guided endonuclease IscB [Ktedonobacteraceae bacterium]|jgi:5-methylcytosine-specific restriction endonuclease McrA
MSKVFVLDTNRRQLNPIHPARARVLLSSGKAAVYRRYPFSIILKTAVEAPVESLRFKIDPGSKTTGMAVVNDQTGEVVFAAELSHRGDKIKSALDERRAIRRGRRNRHTRYRKPRWQNRSRPKGWLPPSLESRIANVITWVSRFMRVCHITAISMERVKFDMQLMENAEISGVEYQQGTLAGYEVREYLLQKWGRACTYCGKQDIPLQVEHITPRANGGTNRISNLCLACEKCNLAKGTKNIKDFLVAKPDLLKKILTQAKAPLKDAAAVNTTRWELFRQLEGLGLPIECGSGGLTKYNRTMRELPKTHWIDAVCVGKSTPETVLVAHVQPLLITANGHGCRQVHNVDHFGFPHGKPKQGGRSYGFRTGDMVRAVVTKGSKGGTYTGRVLVRATGSFDIATRSGRIAGISHKYCQVIHRTEGYSYSKRKAG